MSTVAEAQRPARGSVGALGSQDTRKQLVTALADLVDREIGYDGAVWFGMDPTTILPSWPVQLENLDEAYCEAYWHAEFFTHDVMHFRDVARRSRPVARLLVETEGLPSRSPLHRTFLEPSGYADAMRCVFRTAGQPWGAVDLMRTAASGPFTADEEDVLARLSAKVGAELRRHALLLPPDVVSHSTLVDVDPGVLVFDAAGRCISRSSHADAWLTAIDDASGPERLPIALHSTVAYSRAVAEGLQPGRARVRIRTAEGRWVSVHAVGMVGEQVETTVILAPASAAELGPMMSRAYGLTPREDEIARLVARGMTTAAIARSLFLSEHTVRDHVKNLLDKVGVSSRVALVARLFCEKDLTVLDD